MAGPLFYDPFVYYWGGVDTENLGEWVELGTSSFGTTDGPYGLGRVRVGGWWDWGSNSPVFGPASGAIIHQLWHRVEIAGWSTTSNCLLYYNNGGTALCLQYGVNENASVVITDQAGSVVHTSAAGLVPWDTYYLLGIKADIGSSGGTVKVWINRNGRYDAPDISLTGIDMSAGSSGGCDKFRHASTAGGTPGFGHYNSCSHLFFADTSAGGINSYLGIKRWYALAASGNGAANTWTPSAGSNYECVDDPVLSLGLGGPTDADRTQGASGAGAELFTTAALSADVTGIVAAGAWADIRKSDATAVPDTQIRTRASTGATADSAVISSLSDTQYQLYGHITTADPSGLPWTLARVNALQVGAVVGTGGATAEPRMTAVCKIILANPEDVPEEDDCCCSFDTMMMGRPYI